MPDLWGKGLRADKGQDKGPVAESAKTLMYYKVDNNTTVF